MKKILVIFAAALLSAFHFPLSTFHSLQAQGRFDATVSAGLNMAQIDGDATGTYNHPGLRAGVGTAFNPESPWRPVVELAYTQKGSFISQYNRRLSADYVEVALMMSYNCMGDRLRMAFGVAPGVLVRSQVDQNGSVDQAAADNFCPVDWLPLTVALRYRIGDHLCVEGRWQNSMLSVTKENGSGTYRIFRSNTGLFHRLVTFGLGWQF